MEDKILSNLKKYITSDESKIKFEILDVYDKSENDNILDVSFYAKFSAQDVDVTIFDDDWSVEPEYENIKDIVYSFNMIIPVTAKFEKDENELYSLQDIYCYDTKNIEFYETSVRYHDPEKPISKSDLENFLSQYSWVPDIEIEPYSYLNVERFKLKI